MTLSRRRLLATGLAAAGSVVSRIGRAPAAQPPQALTIKRRVIEVNKQPASVYGIFRKDGRPGVELAAGEDFRATLTNEAGLPTLIHWHGQTPPLAQDGVPGLSQPLLRPGGTYDYSYKARPGTHWMHSHEGLHEQLLMAAPLIVRENGLPDVPEVVVMLHDFTFTDAAEVFAKLGSGQGEHAAHMAMMGHGAHAGHQGHGGGAPMVHLHDVEYDAFLANDRTLDDPEVVRAERGGEIRIRLINAATATAFIIDTGALPATVLAVDGGRVINLQGRRFPMAMGQRLDLLVKIPRETGAWPILARREGDTARTGIVLATQGARIAKIASKGPKAPAAGLELERRLRAATPLPKREPDRRLRVVLGEKPPYIWTLNDATFEERRPLSVRKGQRIHLTFENPSSMMHPMHLHGHHFQVIGLGGAALAGAMRDTVIVPANGGRVTVAFDADNVGEWMLHCHNLYHMAAGMMTTVKYEA